ncbi:MAG: metallophosphoesterase [Candidatus Eisenbacteria bacterium]|nr:metallophosphoesterase [Candidatus Eisenbacteria bacterium]
MRHALLSDVHGNLPALEAVLADVAKRGVDDMVCLGDFVGYGADPNECIAQLEDRIEWGLLGNHDQAVVDPSVLADFNDDAAAAARWTRRQLTPRNLAYLGARPLFARWHGARLAHASPSDPGAWNYLITADDAEQEFEWFDEPVCFVGHTHMPIVFQWSQGIEAVSHEHQFQGRRDRRYLIVVPSVGQPRDGDPRAGYLVWDDESWTFEQVRLEYDIERAAQRILDAGLPPWLAERLRLGN